MSRFSPPRWSKRVRNVVLLAILAALLGGQAIAGTPSFRVWVTDSLLNILPNTSPPASPPNEVHIDAVRNEYESGQIVVTAAARVASLTVSIGAVSGPSGAKPQVSYNFVGYVPVQHGTPYTPSDNLIAVAPANLPDPLLESTSVAVDSGKNQPIWITARVPLSTVPGRYTCTLTITGDGVPVAVPLVIDVSPVMVPDKRTLSVTNWLSYEAVADYHGLTIWSEPYWSMLYAYAKCMADHRMNVVLTRVNKLIIGHDDGAGHLTFDFSRFDRWVAIFASAGAIGTIEGGHLSGRISWEGADYYVWYPAILDPSGHNIRPSYVIATSSQGRAFYSQFLPALQQHLEQKGWLNCYIQHVGDEPIAQSAASYRAVAAIVRQYAPKLKIVDATMCTDLVGAVDIWVPQPQDYYSNRTFFEQRKSAGDQVWIYTCLTPKGEYMNRFVDYPLIDTRLLHWANYKYNLPGYLHWGFNSWHGDPFTNIEYNYGSPTTAFSPPGDTHIVYKGANGPLSSIRLEALRDGIEDYELLKLLQKRDPTRAAQICDSVVRSLTDYTRDPAAFRSVRTQLVSALAANPLSVNQTKLLPAGSQVFVTNGVITADLRIPNSYQNLFYVEAQDRSAGIGVSATGNATYTAGQRADIFGQLFLRDGAELLIEPDVVSTCSGSPIKPLGMTNRAAGGGAFAAQPAVMDDALAQPQPIASRGAGCIGKLVKTWGMVTGWAQTSLGQVFWIDDGSSLRDGSSTSQNSPAVGLGVLLPPGIWIMPTGRVCVTGILRAVPNPSGYPVRLLVPRSGSDISP